MRSRTFQLPAGPLGLLAEASREAGRAPDFVLAFLPPDEHLPDSLAALAAAWPESLRFGCEAVTQFADDALTTRGSLQLFWFDDPAHHAEVQVVAGTHAEPPSAERIGDLARHLATADGALLIADGLRFPAERFLDDLRRALQARLSSKPAGGSASPLPWMAGGLASQREPVTRAGARVFLQEQIFPAACLAVTLHGVEMHVEVVRGWTPASPVYTVTRAAGQVLHEIDGESATEWYRRFFTIDGQLAPMPDAANRFPLIVEGPAPERQGLYRSLRFFDDPPGAVTFWGSIEKGDRVRLGMGNERSLVQTASRLPRREPPQAAILYSCVGREMVLGERAGNEVAAIHEALGGAALSGFFTFGEIGPTPHGGLSFYNHTAILVLLHEEGT
ncbi:MAG TPA: FIST N-terminal domain-containing protein [Thermoanaerobaculia bacterium]|nr:FIST N-terminal domain-containing protein [Thermoanaerobaculia bacterium]